VTRLIFPVVLGIVGVAILISLGVWQLQRLAWKEGILAQIDATISADPVDLPANPDPSADKYLPVIVTGALGGEEIHVLTSVKDEGPGYRVISVLTSGDRRLMVDLGFVLQEAKTESRIAESVTVTGNIHWPDEVDGWTPAPDRAANIWFARSVTDMAETLGAEPFLIVARTLTSAGSGSGLPVTPMPIDSAGISNDHLNYAITWFSLAVVWAVMSGFLLLRVARTARKD
jgi:surfeit locus 1 family protein